MKEKRWLIRIGLLGCMVWFLVIAGRLTAIWYRTPYLVSMDVRGREIDAQGLQQWKEEWNREKREPGILGVTGWRWEKEGEVYAPDTGRRMDTAVIGVCGAVSEHLPFAGRLLAGRMFASGLLAEESGLGRADVCLVSGRLAEGLFGSYDVVGGRVCLGTKEWTISGVVNGKEAKLIVPAQDGEMDGAAIWVKGPRGKPVEFRF